ncbi:MAG: DNA polymerase Y family protein [Planctomycetaceae bacterium]|nr:DNA polymerase Y family protein [Planctomycetaceae bacterium]
MGFRKPRILCLWFPDWPVQRLTASHPELAESALLITETGHRGEFVHSANSLARQRGIRPGMPVSEARTRLVPGDREVVEPLRADLDTAALRELAPACEPFGFCPGLEEADRPECLLLEITGVDHFFGGERSLAECLDRAILERQYDGRIAVATSVGAAWAAAHFLARARRPVLLSGADTPRLESLPLSALRLGEKTISRLSRLGVRTIRQLLTLDRAALLRRLGREPLLRMDQFTGNRPERIVPCQPVPRYQVERHLETGITHPEAIESLWSHLLEQLLKPLRPQRLGTRRLECRFHLEDRPCREIHIRLREATHNLRHIGELLGLQLERTPWDAPVTGVSLEACEIGPLVFVSPEMFEGTGHQQARQFSLLLNRLSSRLGEEAVLLPELVPNPIPERSFRYRPACEEVVPITEESVRRFHGLDRPPVLFSPPRPLEIIGAVCDTPAVPQVFLWQGTRLEVGRMWGPERIETGWWQTESVSRDYYHLETSLGQWIWIFRRLSDGHWFWHGEWR